MWYEAEYSVEPKEIDSVSSSVYVYVRKDIKSIEKKNEANIENVYYCKEQKILKSDWEIYEKMLSHDIELVEVQDALIELSGLIVGE